MANKLPDTSNEEPGGFYPINSDDPEANASVKEHILCSQCRNLTRRSRNITRGAEFREYEQFSHYPTFQDVEKSARHGCHLCSLIQWKWADVAQKLSKGNCEPGRQVTVEIEKTTAPVMIERINVNPLGRLGERHKDMPSFEHRFLRIDRYQSSSARIRGRSFHGANWLDSSEPWHAAQLAKSTASDATFELAKYWLERCLTHHRECCEVRPSPNQWPTRLLAVGQEDTVRLVLTSELAQVPKYLTLSHCWGGADIIKLKAANFSSFRKSILLSALPKTFKDAIVITRRLGYEYLWIDSLCIIQDSAEDWSKESSIVGMIYRQSVCTIAALAAQNSHEGCFTKRNPLFYRHCRILGDSEKGVYVLGATTPKMWVTGGYGQPCKLNKRGWVVQERLLSPRTLYFGPRSIGWECIECEATETEPDEQNSFSGQVDTLRPKRTFAFLGRYISKSTSVSSAEFITFRNAWWTIVSTYTGCDLTFPSDKLAAITGMIRVIESITGLTNVSGHWKEFLLQDILWKAWISGKRAASYRAPSWSWASMDYHVYGTYFDNIFETVCNSETKLMYELEWMAQVEDVGTTPVVSGSSWSGQVSGAYIRLRGQARMMKSGNHEGYQQLFDDDGDRGQQNLSVLIVRGTKRLNQDGSAYNGPREFQDEGLMLAPVDAGQSRWRRIGIFFQTFQEATADAIFSAETAEKVLVVI